MRLPTALVKQRETDDCTLCCIAMALDLPYSSVRSAATGLQFGYRWQGRQGTMDAGCVVDRLAQDVRFSLPACRTFHRPFGCAGELITWWLWGRRALLSVPSLNGFDGEHTVYWDGLQLFDPSNGENIYPDTLDGLTPSEVTIFDETRAPRDFAKGIKLGGGS